MPDYFLHPETYSDSDVVILTRHLLEQFMLGAKRHNHRELLHALQEFMRPYSSQIQLITLDEATLRYIARANGWSVPSNGLIINPPNHISMVFQWRVFSTLMAHLPRDREISWFHNH
jgi:hypothetical protein